jgi:YD repeat-containing protein
VFWIKPKGEGMKNSKLIVFLLSVATLTASAGVNLKNGNYYVSYTDIVVPGGGKKLEITRTYNSKSTSVGWFGFGWGNIYETNLTPSPDGCVVVNEYGSGGKTRFCPKAKVDPELAAKKIVEAMRKKSKTQLPESSLKTLMERLKTNSDLRHAYAKNFGVQSNIAKGTTLYSNQRGIQKITVTGEGYERHSNSGKKEYFDKKGLLKKIKEKNGYYVEFKYKKGVLYSLKDSQAKQVFFKWNSNNKISELWSTGDKKAVFKYDGDNLIVSRDIAGNQYGFNYDKSHNLTKVIYNPYRFKGVKEDAMVMKYEPKTFFISEIIDRSGDSVKYKYGSNPKNPDNHYWTSVTKKGFSGKPVTNKYEYEIKNRPDGSSYTYRIYTKINSIKTETIYSECCGLPLKIARGKHVTNFEYNAKGLLTKKQSTKGDFVQIKYDKILNKISEVKNNSGWTKFKYDKKGNLTTAKNSKNQAVKLIYDRKGKINKMVDKNLKTKKTRTLSFTYNALGKPTEISMSKVGKINVAYDNYGEIKRVESKSGHKMALQVTQAFQNLLSIVKPAGVNLNM